LLGLEACKHYHCPRWVQGMHVPIVDLFNEWRTVDSSKGSHYPRWLQGMHALPKLQTQASFDWCCACCGVPNVDLHDG